MAFHVFASFILQPLLSHRERCTLWHGATLYSRIQEKKFSHRDSDVYNYSAADQEGLNVPPSGKGGERRKGVVSKAEEGEGKGEKEKECRVKYHQGEHFMNSINCKLAFFPYDECLLTPSTCLQNPSLFGYTFLSGWRDRLKLLPQVTPLERQDWQIEMGKEIVFSVWELLASVRFLI